MNDLTSHQPSTSTYETDVATEVTRLLRLFDRRRLSATEFAEIVGDYLTVLRGLSLDAISEAVMRFSRGQVDWASKTFAPTPAELYSVADGIDEAYRARQETARRIEQRLALPPPPLKPRPTLEELKARFGETWGLKAAGPLRKTHPVRTEEQSQAYLEALRDMPVEVSPELAAMCRTTKTEAA